MNPSPTESELDWVLVLAPFRKDADYIAAFLREHNIAVKAGGDGGGLAQRLSKYPGVVVIAHEALNPEVIAGIGEHLAGQPDWSELPILVLLERAAPQARIREQLQRSWQGCRVLFHVRPITPLELVNSIQSNLLVRLRQRQVRDAIERERELRLELNHRVKNILASISSIFQMTRRGAITVEELAEDFAGRLQALSNVHSAVFEAGGEEVSLAAIVSVIVSPYNHRAATRIFVSGPDAIVARIPGTTMALCLHELITNAIKYGALSHPEGKVDITWEISGTDEPMFDFEWKEADGPPVMEPSRQGYGTRYIRSSLGALFGSAPEITFPLGGFRCSVSGPLARLTRDWHDAGSG
jgi:two-component sensor histidine kinase